MQISNMTIEWKNSNAPIDYQEAQDIMEDRVGQIISKKNTELIWFLEHPPLYTAGTSAKPEDLLSENKFPIYQSGRGGQYTYHGPGQRVMYLMLDLKNRAKNQQPDLRKYVFDLEQLIINTLSDFSITGERRNGRIGIWVNDNGKESKIAAIGIRVRNWVTYHGLAINLHPNLEHYSGIIPCGIKEYGVTSVHELGKNITTGELDCALKYHFGKLFS